MNNDDIVSEVSLPIIHALDIAFSLPYRSLRVTVFLLWFWVLWEENPAHGIK